MAHSRLDDKRIELSAGGVAWAASATCPAARRNNAVVCEEPPTVPTLEAENGRTSMRPATPVRAALAHIGRGEQNDVVAADDSVSPSRARTQRPESGWFVVDMLSTNGSYASGECAPGKAARTADSAVRFGDMKVIFRSEPERVDADGGTRELVEFKPSEQWRAPLARPSLS